MDKRISYRVNITLLPLMKLLHKLDLVGDIGIDMDYPAVKVFGLKEVNTMPYSMMITYVVYEAKHEPS